MYNLPLSLGLQLVQALTSHCRLGECAVGLGVRNWESHLLAFNFAPEYLFLLTSTTASTTTSTSIAVTRRLLRMMHQAKRLRLSDDEPRRGTTEAARPICYLTRMPLELLAEILSYAQSPKDILSLSRTSKHFCTILVNNRSTNFIWRQVRARAYPNRIPDFTPNFTEASYAALLFDSKLCEVRPGLYSVSL